MEQQLRDHLLSCASAFIRARGLNETTVGRLAAGDWRYFKRLREGVTFTVKKYDDVIEWFSDNWPDGVVWPSSVPRPEKLAS